MTKEEILRDRDNLRNLLSRAKGEFERQLAVAEQQRDTSLGRLHTVNAYLVIDGNQSLTVDAVERGGQ